MKQAIAGIIIGASAVMTILACAEQAPLSGEPVLNVDPRRHPNIARAQELSRQAYDMLSSAQQANEFDLGGHAARAKEFLREANEEMKLAAMALNQRR